MVSKNRKVWFSIGTSAAIIGGAALCGAFPAMIPVYPEMVAGLLGVLALYVTGNVATKHVIGKPVVPAPPVTPEDPLSGPASPL